MSAIHATARPAQLSESNEVLQLSTEAFADEAVLAWVMNNPTGVRDQIRELFASSLQETIEAGDLILACMPEGQPIALSLWHKLDKSPHSQVMAESSDEPHLTDPVARKFQAVTAATAARHPNQPHMFLSSMATHPEFRGRGAGAAMLRYGIDRAEAHKLPIYLEASTPQNRRLYHRHDFSDVGSPITLPEDGPMLQPMWRPS